MLDGIGRIDEWTALCGEIYIVYFISLWLIWGNICRKRERSAGKVLSLFRQIFPFINYKLKRFILHYIYSNYFVNKSCRTKKKFQTLGIGKIFTVIGKYFPLLKLRQSFTNNISKNRHMKYINISSKLIFP